jgi:predicted PhzF superfamily epimerase YddE/YHI9
MSKATLHVLSVFTDEQGMFGNPLGVVADGAIVPEESRQRLAYKLGFGETVFVDDAKSGRMRLYTPARELPFAGHAVLGAAWLLDGGAKRSRSLRPPAGEVGFRFADGLTWIRGRPEWCPAWEHVQVQSAQVVAEATAAPNDLDAVQL